MNFQMYRACYGLCALYDWVIHHAVFRKIEKMSAATSIEGGVKFFSSPTARCPHHFYQLLAERAHAGVYPSIIDLSI